MCKSILIVSLVFAAGCSAGPRSGDQTKEIKRNDLVLVRHEKNNNSAYKVIGYKNAKESIDYLFAAQSRGVKMTTTTIDPTKVATPIGPLVNFRSIHTMYVVKEKDAGSRASIHKNRILMVYVAEGGELWIQSRSWDPHSYWYLDPEHDFGYSVVGPANKSAQGTP
jgi:hypothetical protein